MDDKCKYYIQFDSGVGYQSNVIEIDLNTYNNELNKCEEIVNSNESYFRKNYISKFEDRVVEEIMFGFNNVDIYLINIKYL